MMKLRADERDLLHTIGMYKEPVKISFLKREMRLDVDTAIKALVEKGVCEINENKISIIQGVN